VHVEGVARAGEEQVKWLALVTDEGGHPVELLLKLRLGEELPHAPLLPSVGPAAQGIVVLWTVIV
jgi:hypothetical protein